MATILVIEDEPNIRRFISINLEVRGHTVAGAETGAIGLRLLRDLSPHLLFLDMMLPDMNGGQVLAAMSEDDSLKAIPVILMSASLNIADALKYANVVQHVMKPASVTVLLEALQKALP
jgi:CheY-like chemotaxis protein